VKSSYRLFCDRCDSEIPLDPIVWRCPACNGPLDFASAGLDPLLDRSGAGGFWDYGPWLPEMNPLRLGEPVTPTVELDWKGTKIVCKVESALPTGSFKDRGNAILTSMLRDRGVRGVVEDSSGNSAASLAAYCARAGISCDVFVPAATSPAKMRQAEALGASVHRVEGTRQDAARAARQLVDEGATYASHVWSPLFLVGTQTFTFELFDQFQGRLPDAIVMPVGAGTLFLGAYHGLVALKNAGLIKRMPRLYGVQPSGCSPIADAFARQLSSPVEFHQRATVAEGAAIARPLRGASVLRACVETGGAMVSVDDESILEAQHQLALNGILVEPTAALGLAAVDCLRSSQRLTRDELVLAALTGHGLKTLHA
jgi:threonine synthase